ncbi:MAG: hypothetical protein LBK41_02165 [Clostridiales bacterium]|jgi:hypothetical protein|nr:hypothetical protein [Clostridiales bacterium]
MEDDMNQTEALVQQARESAYKDVLLAIHDAKNLEELFDRIKDWLTHKA